jgi:flagellin
MTSILTNTASMVALASLTATQKSLTMTQNHISTGLAVATAKDNASTWAVATQLRSDSSNLQQVSQNLGSADSIVGAALAGATQISSLISQIQTKVVAEANGLVSATAVQSDISALVSEIQNIVSGSSVNGINMLSGSGNSSLAFASTVISNTSGYAQVQFISVTPFSGTSGSITSLATTSGGGLANLTGIASTSVSSTNLSAVLQTLDTMQVNVNQVAAALGSAQANIEGQQTFVNNLVTTLQTTTGNLVDADMTQESARLSALQTQQSLGTQALSIANQAPQQILKLVQ